MGQSSSELQKEFLYAEDGACTESEAAETSPGLPPSCSSYRRRFADTTAYDPAVLVQLPTRMVSLSSGAPSVSGNKLRQNGPAWGRRGVWGTPLYFARSLEYLANQLQDLQACCHPLLKIVEAPHFVFTESQSSASGFVGPGPQINPKARAS